MLSLMVLANPAAQLIQWYPPIGNSKGQFYDLALRTTAQSVRNQWPYTVVSQL
jgi:hypothetical protein